MAMYIVNFCKVPDESLERRNTPTGVSHSHTRYAREDTSMYVDPTHTLLLSRALKQLARLREPDTPLDTLLSVSRDLEGCIALYRATLKRSINQETHT